MLPQLLNRLRRGIYTDTVKRIFQRTGLEDTISSIYWPLFLRLSSGVQTACVDDVCADFYVTDRIEYMRIVEGGMAEEDILQDILKHTDGQTVFYDVGANIGTFSCIVGSKLTEGCVIAFEPHPANEERLTENIELNGIPADIFDYALDDVAETTFLQVDPDVSDVGAPKHSLSTEKEASSIEVRKETCDRIIAENGLPTPDIVKIDVEGAELGVLRGMEETLSSVSFVYCEVHQEKIKTFEDTTEELHEYLQDQGFSIRTFSERPPQYFILAQNTG